MSTTGLILWAVLLIIQNFSFTLVSRARNSGSYLFHGVAAIFSNGVWFGQQFILIDNFITIIKTADWLTGILLGLFYTFFTVIGSLSSHYVSMNYIEKGERKVGSSAKKEPVVIVIQGKKFQVDQNTGEVIYHE